MPLMWSTASLSSIAPNVEHCIPSVVLLLLEVTSFLYMKHPGFHVNCHFVILIYWVEVNTIYNVTIFTPSQ